MLKKTFPKVLNNGIEKLIALLVSEPTTSEFFVTPYVFSKVL